MACQTSYIGSEHGRLWRARNYFPESFSRNRNCESEGPQVACFNAGDSRRANAGILRLLLVGFSCRYVFVPFLVVGYRTMIQRLFSNSMRQSLLASPYPFLSYASHFWSLHGATFQFNDSDRENVRRFFDTQCLPRRGNFGVWVQTLIPDVNTKAIDATSPLYYAASFGLVPVVKTILESDRSIDINARGGRHGSTPLFVACWRHRYQVAEILLEAGADPHV